MTRDAQSTTGITWMRREAYDREFHARRLAFRWAAVDADREAWFVRWEAAGVERECDECWKKIDPKEPAWVSGGTGYVLCSTCADEAELLQSGTFSETFTPDP